MQAIAFESEFAHTHNRRNKPANINEHWHKLTIAQRFAFYTLMKLGYRLLFVRQSNGQKTAVAQQDEQIITINNDGDIDYNPNLILREAA